MFRKKPAKKDEKPSERIIENDAGVIDLPYLILTLILLAVGLVMLFSASYAEGLYREGNSLHYIERQSIFAVAGIIVMFVAAKFNYHLLHRFAIPIWILTAVLLVLCYFQPAINGCRRWIFIGGFGFQPSEIAKFAIILTFAHFMSLFQKTMHTFKHGVLPYLLLLGPICALILFETHLSCTILVGLIGLTMMFIGGTRKIWFGMGGILVACALVYVVISGKISYAMDRIDIWWDPFIDAQGAGFQNIQSLYAISSGGFLGLGLGNSRQKYLYIPEPQNDFIFSIVCEELGYIGAAVIIVLFALLVWRGFTIALKARDRFGSLLVIGIMLQLGLQTLLNIAVVTKTIPNTGISLPFFSYGGTSLLMLLAEMGVVLSVSRYSAVEKA